MEPDRFVYSPIMARPRLEWPNGARLAVWVLPNVEHYEYQPVHSNRRNPWPRSPHPDVLGYGTRDYGNRVGVWRMFELMDKHDIRCTASLNFSVIEHYPEIFEAMQARRYDYLCHGLYNTRYLWGLPEDEERAVIRDCVEALKRATGRQLAGWFGPAASFTLNTPDLVAEAGIKYCTDWYHDDQPFPMKVRRGRLITLPYSMDINDAIEYRYATEGEEFARMIVDHFDTVYAEGGRVMAIALHPYLYGQPRRIRHLDRALAYLKGHGDVWWATGEEIADHYIANCLPAVEAHLAARAGGKR
jgi:peptidoglycan/xylan/chitin deacetylase (PgdA/CDA1 family)